LSYSHTRAQLKVLADLVFFRTNPLWTKNEARQYRAIGCYSLDPSSVESKKKELQKRPAGHTAGLFLLPQYTSKIAT